MSRIIPWKLPDVQGGSIGGYTPAPTPVTPSNDPYDFANLVFTPEFEFVWLYAITGANYNIFKYAQSKITMSGVTILNSVEVAQVVAEIGVSSGTVTGTLYDQTTGSRTIADQTLEIDITSLMTPSGGVITASEYSGKYHPSYNSTLRNLPTYIAMNHGGYEEPFTSGWQPSMDDTYPTIDSNTSALTLEKITVYNANGVALQEYTPGE